MPVLFCILWLGYNIKTSISPMTLFDITSKFSSNLSLYKQNTVTARLIINAFA